MRPLRAIPAFIAALSLILCAARAADAQEWNDARTRALVLAAIERRALQLADTGLRDYTARAHGYLTFLAQLGEGFPDPPTLVKSDELMVEVYWGAPDRSKQRVIGRRDTLLLPTDIRYHRDHLGVVQNDFPAIIRLGDGDEVRDVAHPLSAAGLAVYDYRISDSLAIRTADRAIDVMMVTVRPKDDRQPAAVGAVHIDRVTASVVRMTFSFTRAALKDRQLEDVSVILENGLVDGRFWLPRRQEIEIRRSTSWMELPARGIIRGRWEICCVQPNVGLPASTFTGPEIAEAPLAQQRAFAFEGTVLGNLPEEVRALDAEEVRRVQEEARALVRAGALSRARSTSVAARGVSDFLRVDRVDGLAFGAGLTQRLGRGFSTSVSGRYGTASDEARWRGSVEWRAADGLVVSVSGVDDFREAGDLQEVSRLRNSIAAQEFGSDWTDPFGARGGALRVTRPAVLGGRLSLELVRESQRPLAVAARPATGRYAPTIAADRVELWSVGAHWDRVRTADASGNHWRIGLGLSGARPTWLGTGETTSHLRASINLERHASIGAGRLVLRTLAVGLSAGPTPRQAAVFFGGPATAPGYAFHSIAGRAGVSQRVEWQSRIPFVPIDLGRFGKVPSSLTVAPFANVVWMAGSEGAPSGWFPSVGLGTIAVFDLLRFDVARTLRGPARWMFSVDVGREWWPVL